MTSIPVVFADYQVLDHLLRIELGKYRGKSDVALRAFRRRCSQGSIELWVAEITQVEMIQGRENPRLSANKLAEIKVWDQRKIEIAAEMRAKRLGYPCSKLNDTYSRLNVSFRTASPVWAKADTLERRLLDCDGVSEGDARHLVSVVYGPDDQNPRNRPAIEWVVTEDKSLRNCMNAAIAMGKFPEFMGVRFVSVADFEAAQQ